MNRLAQEKSPYLLQHAHNPVDWYAWGQEAFDKARAEEKPIFLSIGYSTCHWCHVMERESFESQEIAEVLNRDFVPIKVDREERPDVDRIYMTFVQATTGGGGWPMSVFLTPDLKPFFGGTYFPPDNRYGRPGFKSVLEHLANAWKNDRARILQSAKEVIEQLGAPLRNTGHGIPDNALCESGFHAFRRMFDSTHGGFGGAPKFPRPVTLSFLLRYADRTGTPEATDMVLQTLRAMAEGGMYDHIGGGFHRYSVDDIWFVPHFEKMLYDQAQLAVAYLEAFQITHDEFYASVARNIFTYILRDMTAPEGGFWSAEDADSTDPEHPHEKREGAFYLWTEHEVFAALGHPTGELVVDRFGIEKNGNVSNDPHGEFTGRNIVFLAQPVEDIARTAGLPLDMVRGKLAESCAKLLEVRSKRPRPHLDDKILAAWNGLMISAFAKGAQVLNEPAYADAARRAAEFVMSSMWQSGDRVLLRRYRDGDAAIPAFLDDYAFMAQGLLDLYETVFDFGWLDTAIALTERMRELFEDKQNGAFFSTAEDDTSLPLRMKDDYDGAEPAGNSVAILNLVRLARLTGRKDFHESADRALRAMVPRVAAQPAAVPVLLTAMMYSLSHSRQIILAGERESPATRAFLEKVHDRFLPDSVVLLVDSDETRNRLRAFNPTVDDMRATNGKTMAYVCRDYACELPTDDVERFSELLK